MNTRNSKRLPPLGKLFGKLRSLIALTPAGPVPYRSWDSAASREIQLEFDFGHRRRQIQRGGAANTIPKN